MNEVLQVPLSDFGIDYDGPIPLNDNSIFPLSRNLNLNAEQITHLNNQVNPLQESSVWGIDLYIHATETIYEVLCNSETEL